MSDDAAIFIWSLVLIGAIVVVFLAVAIIRRRFFRTEKFPAQGFTVEELRRLRDSGQISAAEYEKAKASLVADAGRGSDKGQSK